MEKRQLSALIAGIFFFEQTLCFDQYSESLYREVFCDEVEQFCSFSFLAGCVWHQYLQWHKDVNLGYDLQKKKTMSLKE